MYSELIKAVVMSTKAKLTKLIEQLGTIPEIKHLDMYYNQDENMLNIPKYPAVLVGIPGINYDREERATAYDQVVHTGLLLFHSSIKNPKDKELECLDLIDAIFEKIRKSPTIVIKTANCLERTSKLTTYFIEIDLLGDYI